MKALLVDYLRTCCVRVLGVRYGCGFFIAPRLVVTCAHVVGHSVELGEPIALEQWHQGKIRPIEGAIVLGNFPDDDLAFIQTVLPNESFAPLSGEVTLGNTLTALGFPDNGGRQVFDQFSAVYEGKTFFIDRRGRETVESKFKAGQVEPGFSGGPLLNINTSRVMGVVVATRDKLSSLGGWAIEISVIERLLLVLQQEQISLDSGWLEIEMQQQPVIQRDTLSERSTFSECIQEIPEKQIDENIWKRLGYENSLIRAFSAITIICSLVFGILYFSILEITDYSFTFSDSYNQCKEVLINEQYEALSVCESVYKFCESQTIRSDNCQDMISRFPLILKEVLELKSLSFNPVRVSESQSLF